MILRLSNIVETALAPALTLLGKNFDSRAARVMLLAIGLQESRLEQRYQVIDGGGKGPARGLWQFELGTRASRGGVWGVYMHGQSMEPLRILCRDRDCNFDPRAIWERLEHDDILAAGVARLLLWTNKNPLPDAGDPRTAWDYYINTWRPGKPKPGTWNAFYTAAYREVTTA
jgi:hypothetical protein